MRIDTRVLTIACLLASAPLVWLLLHRTMAGSTVPVVRLATFNVALNRERPGELLAELRAGSAKARAVAEIVQRCEVDVLLLCELDRDDAGAAARLFASEYLGKPQNGQPAIDFPFVFVPEVNTGAPSGRDLDRDGKTDGAGDAWGYGAFPGQYGMALLSRHPLGVAEARTFRTLRWSAMPDARRPPDYWSDADWQELRLSSKTHFDLLVQVQHRHIHLLCSHPTPPVFDGDEDRNGGRNHDEIRFWSDYLTPARSGWIVDDQGRVGGLPPADHFAVLGDLNCDPVDGDAQRAALQALLQHDRVQDPQPTSAGAVAAATAQWGSNSVHQGDPALDTGDFDDTPGRGPGNLRVDYVLPSRSLSVAAAGVFWPQPQEAGASLLAASDHRLVWVDVALEPAK